MKTLLVIDSTFYMKKETFESMDIKVIPLTVHLDNIVYSEKFDDGESNYELFDKIFEKKTLATTSQPTPEAAMKIYQEAIDEGYEKIISLHLSSGLSGTIQGMKNAAQMVLSENKHSKAEIHVFDTLLAAQASAIVASEVYDIIQDEGDIDVKEVQDIINHYCDNIKIFFSVDKMDFLVFGGRLKPAIASVLNVFGISPMLTLNEGEIDKFAVARSKKAVLSKIQKELEAESFTKNDDVIFAGVYTTSDKMTKKLMKTLLKETDANIISSEISAIGLIIGNHLGPDAYGIGWSKKYKRKSK